LLGQILGLAFTSEAPAIADSLAQLAGSVLLLGIMGSRLQVICLLIE
jgi:hypothetical protein